MSVSNFSELENHIGHDVKVVFYADDKGNRYNVAIECYDCNEVLLDFDRDEELYETVRVDASALELVHANLYELLSDFEDLNDEELISVRDCMLNRVGECLSLITTDGYGDN